MKMIGPQDGVTVFIQQKGEPIHPIVRSRLSEAFLKALEALPKATEHALLGTWVILGGLPLSDAANREKYAVDKEDLQTKIWLLQMLLDRPNEFRELMNWMKNLLLRAEEDPSHVAKQLDFLNYLDQVEKPPARFYRDRAIITAIGWLKDEHKIAPTRNRAQRDRESGCSIIAKALALRGVHLTDEAVEKIWEKRPTNFK
jgi:hypothetical protein